MRKSVLFSVFLFVVALLFGNFALANELFVGTKDGFASVTKPSKLRRRDTIFIATGVYQELETSHRDKPARVPDR